MKDRISVGYKALVENLNLNVIPACCWSYIARGQKKTIIEDGQEIQLFPKDYALSDPENPFEQLEFALKYEGLNLDIIKAVFKKLSKKDIEKYIKEEPLGKIQRKIWYIYECLFGERLNIGDLHSGNYIELLDPQEYYTAESFNSKRHKIRDNLLGNADFCPFVKKTEKLKHYVNKKYDKEVESVLAKYSDHAIRKAMRYFYTQETISTWRIEKEMPTREKEIKFINALHQAPLLYISQYLF